MKTILLVLLVAMTGCKKSSDSMVLGYPQASISTYELSDEEIEDDVDACEAIDDLFTDDEISEMFSDFESNCR